MQAALKALVVQRSTAMAHQLKKIGFKFVGATICYAFMQAVGMIHEHDVDCFLYKSG
jgi:DNA-3-methyladenine glycosylase I